MNYIVSGLLAFAIMIGCLLPPILHFVTGPLGPLIGGFAGGMRSRADFRGALTIGITAGMCLSLFIVAAGMIVMSLQVSLPDFMNNTLGGNSNLSGMVKIAMIPFAVASALGTLGAYLGGRFARKKLENAA